MEASKIMILSGTVLVILSMILLVTQFLLRKLKDNPEENTKLPSGIWFTTLFLSGAILTGRTISVFAEAIDNIRKINPLNPLFDYFKTGSLLTGLTILWLIVWYFLSNTLSVIVTGKRNAFQEAEAGNYVYFLVRGIILTGFTICLLPAFELSLRTFIPNITVPFYH